MIKKLNSFGGFKTHFGNVLKTHFGNVSHYTGSYCVVGICLGFERQVLAKEGRSLL